MEGVKYFRRREQSTRATLIVELAGPGRADPAAPLEMTGTSTVGADNLNFLFKAHGVAQGGVLNLPGELVPEADNAAYPGAIAVYVESSRIGYLPSWSANLMPALGPIGTCQVQLWAAQTPKGLRVRGWVATGQGRVSWPHTLANPPAITAEEQRAQRAAATSRMVDEALGEGGERAEQFKRGMVGRLHYLETVEPIQQFKREGRLTEALALCYGAIAAAENDRGGREPAPWYTEQAAIIHRKLGQRAEEEAVLRRWLEHCPSDRRSGSKIQERLDKLTGS